MKINSLNNVTVNRHVASLISAAALAASPLAALAASEPIVGAVSPLAAQVNVAQSFSASYSDPDGVSSCSLYVDGANQGSMSLTGSLSGTASKSASLSTAGNHTLQVRCTDVNGNVGLGSTTTVNASASGDITSPSAPTNVRVTTSTSDNTPSFAWNASSDNSAVASYEIQIDGSAFAPVGNTLSYTASALADGSHTFGVRAKDSAGNVSATGSVTFSVSAGTSGSTPPSLQPPFDLSRMSSDAQLVVSVASRATLESSTGRTCEFSSATASTRVSQTFGSISDTNMRLAIENFIGCGTISTRWLGAGERIGIVNSYRAAFGRLPSTEAHWSDVIKIGNGRFTAETSASAEAAAQVTFRKIYLRDAIMTNERDRNAVTVMAYGLRPLPRSLSAEAAAIVTFKAVYGRNPSSAQDWDAVRATAYSGATR